MPLFEFICNKCDVTFEQLAKTEDIIKCPMCELPANKQMSTAKFDLHGQGFYKRGNNQ